MSTEISFKEGFDTDRNLIAFDVKIPGNFHFEAGYETPLFGKSERSTEFSDAHDVFRYHFQNIERMPVSLRVGHRSKLFSKYLYKDFSLDLARTYVSMQNARNFEVPDEELPIDINEDQLAAAGALVGALGYAQFELGFQTRINDHLRFRSGLSTTARDVYGAALNENNSNAVATTLDALRLNAAFGFEF